MGTTLVLFYVGIKLYQEIESRFNVETKYEKLETISWWLLLNAEIMKPISLLEVLNSKHPAIQFTMGVSK